MRPFPISLRLPLQIGGGGMQPAGICTAQAGQARVTGERSHKHVPLVTVSMLWGFSEAARPRISATSKVSSPSILLAQPTYAQKNKKRNRNPASYDLSTPAGRGGQRRRAAAATAAGRGCRRRVWRPALGACRARHGAGAGRCRRRDAGGVCSGHVAARAAFHPEAGGDAGGVGAHLQGAAGGAAQQQGQGLYTRI